MNDHDHDTAEPLPEWDSSAPLRARLASRNTHAGSYLTVFTRDQNGYEPDTPLWLNSERTAATAEDRVALLDELLESHGYRRTSQVRGGYRTPGSRRWSMECNVVEVTA